MKIVKTPNIIQKFYPNLIWRIENDENKIFLTIDDCSDDELTFWVLDLLKQYQINATFFCIGKFVKDNNIASEIINSGNAIGNHTYSHLNAFKTSKKNFIDDIEKCENVYKTNLFRPPYGKIYYSQIKYLIPNYKIIMYDVMSYDFDFSQNPHTCYRNVVENSEKGSIVVFHSNRKARKSIKYALPKSIDFFLENSFLLSKIE